MVVEEHRPAADTLPRVEGPAARGATGTAFLQMAASARALLPGGAGSTMLSGMKGFSDRFGHRGKARADVPMAAKSTITLEDLGDGLPHEAADRVHGRALHRAIDLAQPLRFAHHGSETVMMLPESTTSIRPAPALQHASTREAIVHRQYELAPPPSPPEESEAEKHAKSLQPLPPPSPPSPPGAPPPAKEGFLREDQDYRYDRTADEATGALKDAAAANGTAAAAAGITAAAAAAAAGGEGASYFVRAQAAASSTPVLALAIGGGVLLLALVGVGVWCWLSRGKAKKRRAQLEDVQSVFQTETWRKLE